LQVVDAAADRVGEDHLRFPAATGLQPRSVVTRSRLLPGRAAAGADEGTAVREAPKG
jgi:hypothetical protein